MITGAGTGYLPWFPGTAASLLAVPLSLGLNWTSKVSFYLSFLLLIASAAIATWLCQKGEEIFHEKDCQRIVIDEIAGFLVANFLSPPEFKPTVAALVLFRFFDITKIFPAGLAERLEGGAGVILDDLIAGLYAFLTLRLLLFIGL